MRSFFYCLATFNVANLVLGINVFVKVFVIARYVSLRQREREREDSATKRKRISGASRGTTTVDRLPRRILRARSFSP